MQRLGLPANARCGRWADGRVLAGCSCGAVLMVSWRGALARCSGARGAMLEVDPLPSVLFDLWVDLPPWAQPHGHCYHVADGAPPLMLPPLPPCLLQPPVCLPMQKWAAIHLAAVGPLCSNHPWNPRASKLSELWARTKGSEVAHDIRRSL